MGSIQAGPVLKNTGARESHPAAVCYSRLMTPEKKGRQRPFYDEILVVQARFNK